MRVGVIGPTEPDSFANNIADSLPRVGVEAVPLGPSTPRPRNRALRLICQQAERQTAETVALFQRHLIRRVKGADCDVIINVEEALMPSTVSKIRRGGQKIALWYPDHVANISRMAMIAANYSALFIKDPLFVRRLTQIYGLPAIYMPEACNPRWHRPIGRAGSEPYIVVVGNLYPTRARLLQRLYDVGVPLKLYGGDFPRWLTPGPLSELRVNTFLTREAKSRVFREASGVLNNLHPAEMNSVNARLFEATAAGGAVLCEERDVLKDLFLPKDEVLPFSTFDGLVDCCHALFEEAGLSQAVGDAASKRAHADHTYEVRLTTILEQLS